MIGQESCLRGFDLKQSAKVSNELKVVHVLISGQKEQSDLLSSNHVR